MALFSKLIPNSLTAEDAETSFRFETDWFLKKLFTKQAAPDLVAYSLYFCKACLRFFSCSLRTLRALPF